MGYKKKMVVVILIVGLLFCSDGFESVKLLSKKKAEFLFKDGTTKIVDF